MKEDFYFILLISSVHQNPPPWEGLGEASSLNHFIQIQHEDALGTNLLEALNLVP